MFIRRIAFIVGLLTVVTACAVTTSAGTTPVTEEVPVGGLPPTLPTLAPASTTTTVPRTTVPLRPEELIGSLVTDNRVIVIGDSLFAMISKRHGGELCNLLVPLGWRTEVDAEVARFIEFGHQVLAQRLGAGWDAAVIMLGNNYGGYPGPYRRDLERLIVKLSPRQIVLLTVTEWRPSQRDVNDIILDVASKNANVTIVDWAAITAAHPEYLIEDGLHPNEAGQLALAQAIAAVMGQAPTTPGTCFPTSFSDDSAALPTGSTTTTHVDGGGSTTTTETSVDTTTPSTDPPDTTG